MKILKHGKKFNKNKIQTCGLCGCEFEYDESDVIVNRDFCLTVNPPLYKTYIICPECSSEIFLEKNLALGGILIERNRRNIK